MVVPGLIGADPMPAGPLACDQQKQDRRAGGPGPARCINQFTCPVGLAVVATLRMGLQFQLLNQGLGVQDSTATQRPQRLGWALC
jgi:hypothetical protein